MNKTSYGNKPGFTIVELLIVIVVIGVLAAISTVAYGSMKQRADNATTISAANSAIKLIKAYMAANGEYPVPTGGTLQFCITTTTGCRNNTTSFSTNATFDANIASFGVLPRSVPSFGTEHYGIIGTYWMGRDFLVENGGFFITYILQGTSQQCGLSPVLNSSTSAHSTTGYSNDNVDNTGKTRCVIHIPKPA